MDARRVLKYSVGNNVVPENKFSPFPIKVVWFRISENVVPFKEPSRNTDHAVGTPPVPSTIIVQFFKGASRVEVAPVAATV
jgi:hypothetical protein